MAFGAMEAFGRWSIRRDGSVAGVARPAARAQRQRSRTYRTCAGAFIAMLAIPPMVGLRVDYLAFTSFLWFAAYFAPIVAYAHWRSIDRVRSAVEGLLLVTLLTVPILILSYAAMRLNFPMADARLAGWDAALGLNAGAIVSAVGDVPWLAAVLAFAYTSFSIQILALAPLLAFTGQQARAYWFVEAFFLICAIAIGIAILFPAIGSFSHFSLDDNALGTVNPFFGYHFLDSFNAVRNDPHFVLSPNVASGIITFPSIHAAVAVLCGYAAWSMRFVRVPLVLLNIAMFASAVTHGAHYVVDIFGGGLLALAVIMVRRPLSDDRGAAQAG